MRKPISWEEYWIKQAELIAQRSKDPITQVGAVVIDKDNRQRAAGYNGFPRGVKETEERWERPLKYKFAVHAEINLIANAVRLGVGLADCTMYITIPPCDSCAKAIIQAGITKVVFKNLPNPGSTLDYEQTRLLFSEAGVELVQYQNPQ